MHLFTPESCFLFPAFLFLAPLFIKGLGVSGSPGCASCAFPTMAKDAEERLMIEIAKQQLLDKLHLKERPNITQAVPRVALLTALRKLHTGRVRQDGTLELENKSLTKDKGYEIVSFAEISKFDIHMLNTVKLFASLYGSCAFYVSFMHSAQNWVTVNRVPRYYLCCSIKCKHLRSQYVVEALI